VNKVSTAIQLRFDSQASSLPAIYKDKLLKLHDRRISNEGVIVIKAERFRSQEKNKQDAFQRLQEIVQQIARPERPRKLTKPTRASEKRRLENKTRRGKLKSLRAKTHIPY
jgi:ribosome-associated protein